MNIEETLAAILATLQEIRDQGHATSTTKTAAQPPAEPEEDESEDAQRNKLRKLLGHVMEKDEDAGAEILAKFKATSVTKLSAKDLPKAIKAAEALL